MRSGTKCLSSALGRGHPGYKTPWFPGPVGRAQAPLAEQLSALGPCPTPTGQGPSYPLFGQLWSALSCLWEFTAESCAKGWLVFGGKGKAASWELTKCED